MEVKTLLRYWEGNTFLFDVKVIEEDKKRINVLAEGRALVSTKKFRGKYAGHCCLIGKEEYIDANTKKQVVFACVKRAVLLKAYVIDQDISGEVSREDMIFV